MQFNCQYCCLRTSVVREGGRERVRKGREILCKYLRAVGTPVCLLLERESERESSPFRTPQSSLSLSLPSTNTLLFATFVTPDFMTVTCTTAKSRLFYPLDNCVF